MLSRPSRDQSSCFDMLAAKACSPGSDSILLRRGTHAFAAGRARATTLFSEGRESMPPTGHSQSYAIGNAIYSPFARFSRIHPCPVWTTTARKCRRQ